MAIQKYKKKELLKMVRKLQQKNDSVIGGSQKTADDGLLETLTQCQETALSMGSYLETTGNTAAHLVGILEDYCENIYRMCLFISDEKQCLELSEKIREQLDQLSSMIQQDLPDDRPEAVFLPYKASMWDSMESVWQAAQQDERCDAYVIPVPYFDKNPDGSLGQMHYEGKEYPDYVPVVSWKEYSLEEHRPDMIFIHNPYDECNMVTNIHPAFYSQNLKRYTDILVYIPYFITMNDRISTDFCTLPGVLNADRVIVESENVRKTYIEELCRLEKENHCKYASGSMEEKVVALGSPKLDKMAGVAKESVDIPEAWNKIIRKPDGTAKKVILYNTGITALLNNDERMLAKINDVLRIFYEKRNEVALLWRPHPLMAATLQAMRPFLWEKYRAIAERYRRENWGIYDDTRELDRALCVCDGMVSDPSSLVPLYEATGKPLLLQNTAALSCDYSNERIDAKLFSILEGKDCLWFTDDRFNGLFELSKVDRSIHYLGKFNAEKGKKVLFRLAALDERTNRIYFAPYNAENIAVYNVEEKKFSYIPIPYKNKGMAFFMPVVYGEYVYFTPYKEKAIMKLNTTTKELFYYDDWIEILGKVEASDAYFLYPAIHKNKIYLASCIANVVVEFDMDKDNSTVYEVGGCDYRYSGCCFDGNNYWLTPRRDTPLVKWNPETGIIKEFNVKEFVTDSGNNILFHPALYLDGFILLFPRQSDCILKVHAELCTMETIEADRYYNSDISDKTERFYDDLRSLLAERFGETIYTFDNYTNQLIAFDSKLNKIEAWDLNYPKKVCHEIIAANESYFWTKKSYFMEDTKLASLSRFIDYGVLRSGQENDEQKSAFDQFQAEGTVGKKIYDYVRKLINSRLTLTDISDVKI